MSSFLEDFLKKDIDQSQVNALVGSINQLTTSRSSPVNQVSKNGTPDKVINSLSPIKGISTRSATPTSSVLTTQANTYNNTKVTSVIRSSLPNGSHESIVKPNITPSSHGVGNAGPKSSPSPSKSQGGGAPASNMSHSPQVSIAPKVTNTVPIAPRIGSNIMITPRQAQILMAQRFAPNAALLPNALIARMPGAIPTVVPRIPGHTIAVPPIMNTQIPGIRTVGQRGSTGIINMDPSKARMRMNVPLTAALTKVKGSVGNHVPGQVNYRFRQVNPGNVTSQVTNGVSAQQAAANMNMMKESVKRLKEFFQNLINLASGPNQPPEIGKMVKELVHNLMQSRVTEEEFIDKLQKTLKSDPQPNLVHFLKKTLPHLRDTIKKQQIQQNNAKSTAQVTNQTRPQQVVKSSTLPVANAAHPAGLAAGFPRAVSPHIIMSGKQDPQLLQKQIQQGKIIIATSGQPTPGMKTTLQAHPHAVAPGGKPGLSNAPSVASMTNSAKEKTRSTHYSSAVGGDEEINDVTFMAGVNLMEESQKILATGSDLMSYQTRNIDEITLLSLERLDPLIERIVKRSGLTSVNPEVLKLISHATEIRLRSLMERLTACSLHRNNPHKDDVRYEIIPSVRNQLKVFDEIDEVERKHRESREREMLMRVAKSRSRIEDPEQARLKEKAKQMQLEEEELNRKRAANKTALEAIGGPRKKRKLDEALESLQNSQSSGNSSLNQANTPTSTADSAPQGLRTRQNRITVKDLVFVLESERDTSKSSLLYKAYLR